MPAAPLGSLARVQRVWVVGTSGSGKTTTATAIARALDLPHLELDSLRHQPGWVLLPDDEFVTRVRDWVARPAWVIDGNYSLVADSIRTRADVIVWLDLARSTVMRQVVGRSLRRVVRREELWNGNRERWRNLVSRNPEHNVVVWAWRTHADMRARYGALTAELAAADTDQRMVRLASRPAIDAYVAALGADQSPASRQSPSSTPTRPGTGRNRSDH